MPTPHDRVLRGVTLLLLAALTLWLAVYVLLSLRWRMTHDTPLLFYIAFLMDRFGAVPYVDIFTNQSPGALAFHALIYALFGAGDRAFRLLDLTWLGLISLTTLLLLRPLGRVAAWAGCVLFALSYLRLEQEVSFQRDFIGILPIALAAALITDGRPTAGRRLLAGLCVGLAVTLKPHLGLGLPVLMLYDLLTAGETGGWPRRALITAWPYALGLAAPVAMMLAWLWRLDAWQAYRQFNIEGLPIYLRMNGEHQTIFGVNRLLYLLQGYAGVGGMGAWLAPAALSLYLAVGLPPAQARIRRRILLLAALALTYSLYALLGGKFWAYHWLPFQYFLILTAAAGLAGLRLARPAATRATILATLTLVILLNAAPSHAFYGQLWGQSPRPPKEGRVDAIAAFLQTHLQPDDRVQQLDWTGGATHAMLIAGARMATPYMEDYIFYDEVEQPYVQAQRRRFMEMLTQTRPHFIIEVSATPRPSGPGSSTAFPELRAFLAAHYTPTTAGDGYIIYEFNN